MLKKNTATCSLNRKQDMPPAISTSVQPIGTGLSEEKRPIFFPGPMSVKVKWALLIDNQ